MPKWAAAVLAALVTATTLPAVLSSRPVGADQVSTLRAQAAALAQQLVRQQLEVDADQQQYSVASAQVAADDQAIDAINQQIANTETDISTRSGALRTQAVRSYVDEGAQSASTTLLTGGVNRVQAAAEYQSIAVGNINTQIDRLRTAQSALQSERVQLGARQAADRASRAVQSSALNAADQTAQQLAAAHAQVTGQLASAVSAAQAAQQAAAAAAVAAAKRAASSRSPAAPARSVAAGAAPVGPSGGGGAPSGGGGDPALPPFLQCVVQAESGGNYGAVSPGGQYMGAFQFSQSTWNFAAQVAGRPDLIGVPPNTASKADQDTLALALYNLDGEQPWLGDRCSS
jgi:hypothetical protein